MQIPASNLFADRLPRLVGNGRAEVDEVLAKSILRSPRLKTVAQKIELLVRVSPSPVVILAIDNLRQSRLHHHLRDPVRYSWNPQLPFSARCLRYFHRPHRRRKIAARRQPIPDPVQVPFQVSSEIRNRLLIAACRSLIGLYPFIRLQYLPLRNHKRLCLGHRLLPLLVDPWTSAPQLTPFAPSCFQNFFATTGCSAPRRRIRTLALVVLPLELLRLHRSRGSHVPLNRRPTDSGHLNAGCRPARKQVSSRLFPQ